MNICLANNIIMWILHTDGAIME